MLSFYLSIGDFVTMKILGLVISLTWDYVSTREFVVDTFVMIISIAIMQIQP